MTTPVATHKSVLTQEVLQYLAIKPGGVYLDVTFGVGGHTSALLEHDPTCTVIALDWDASALETYGVPLQEKYGVNRLTLLWGNFALLYKILKKAGIQQVDGILADFGTSQVQITQRAGFSIYRDTPLDMRMSMAHHRTTASEIVNLASEKDLREILWEFGEERFAKQIARIIVQERAKRQITTTHELAKLIERVVPRGRGVHPATKTFQALRIYVNQELENITAFLAEAVRATKPGGRIVCISFHSLEDRLVKQYFADQARLGVVMVVTPKVVVATDDEIAQNSSSRSARLRAAQRA